MLGCVGGGGRGEGLQGELKGALKTARRWPESEEGHPREQEQHEPSLSGPEAAGSRSASGSAREDKDSLSGVLGWQQQVTWNLLEMPVLRPQPRPGGSETPEMGPHSRVSASPPGGAGARRSKGGPCSEPGEQGSR